MRKELLICDYCKKQVSAIEEYHMPRGNNIENFPPRTRTELCFECERLPEIVTENESSDYILLSFDNYNLPAIGRYEIDETGGGIFYEGDETKSCLEYGFFVNAWAPMIKPYREEDE